MFIPLVISFLNAASFALNEPLRFHVDDCLVVNDREHSPGCIHFGVHMGLQEMGVSIKDPGLLHKGKVSVSLTVLSQVLCRIDGTSMWPSLVHGLPRAGMRGGFLSRTSGAGAGLAGQLPALAGSSHKRPLLQRK